jgi:hypothetical protein
MLINYLIIKAKTINLKSNIGRNLHDFGLSNSSLSTRIVVNKNPIISIGDEPSYAGK